METEIPVRKAIAVEYPKIAHTLARAFEKDNFLNWIVAPGVDLYKKKKIFFETLIKILFAPYDEVYTTPDFTGTTVWTPPGRWKMDLKQQLFMLPHFMNIIGVTRLLKIKTGLDEIERYHPHDPHFYLFAIGVDPELQGRGIGKSLMLPVLKQCDSWGIPAYLETTMEKNLSFYRKMGFEVIKQFTIPPDGPAIWLLWREPVNSFSSRMENGRNTK